MADIETQLPPVPRHDRAQLARLRERVLSGFAAEENDLAAIVEPLEGVLAGEVFVVTDLRRVGSPLVHVEPGFERLTGYAPASAVGRDLGFLLHNDTDQEAVREAREAVRDGRAIIVTLRNYRFDGALFWCEQRHHPVRDGRGRVSHLVTVLRDVSDRVHASCAEAVAREGIAGGAAEGTWCTYGGLIDARGRFRIAWVSESIRSVLEVDPDLATRAGWQGSVLEADRGAISEQLAALRSEGGSRRSRYRVRLRGGDLRTIEDFASVSWVAAEAGVLAIHGVLRDVSASRASAPASYDGVDAGTGLPTEAVIPDRLDVAMRRARRHRQRVACVYLALDHFDFVQTHMDAQRGERIVRETARRIRRALRRNDTLARVDAGSFVMILEDLVDSAAALNVVERLLAGVSRPFDDGLLRVELSASVGVALGDGDDDGRGLPDEARTALEAARERGGGHFAFADAETDRALREHRAFEFELRRAFAMQQFEVHYQPRVRLVDGEVTAVEASVRWRHPKRGLLMPADFLAPLQRAQLGGELFEHVLERALRESVARRRAQRPPRVSVNVTAADIDRDDLATWIGRAVQRAGVPPGDLELEVRGDGDLATLERSVGRLGDLRRLGVRVALDGYGVGEPNLALLRALPLDAIKIDGSFVRRLGDAERPGRPADLELVRSMIALGRSLGLTVVAVGVETEFQRARLHSFACEEAQGFLFAAPGPSVTEVATTP